MSAPLKIFMNYHSQPSRAVLALCLFNKIPFTLEEVDIYKAVHFKPDFKKINPLRQIPVIDDNGFLLSESHTIMRYLCDSRQLPDHWFPKDLKKRALVDRYLDWHHANTRRATKYFQASFKELYKPGWITWSTNDEVDGMARAFKRIDEVYLENCKYLDSDEMSIADISAVCEIMNIKTTEFDFSPYPKMEEWLKRCMAHEEMKEVHKNFFNFMEGVKKARNN